MGGVQNRPPLKGSIWDDVILTEALALGIYQMKKWAGDAEYKDDKWFSRLMKVLKLPLRELLVLPQAQALCLAETLATILRFKNAEIDALESYQNFRAEYDKLFPDFLSVVEDDVPDKPIIQQDSPFISPLHGMVYRLKFWGDISQPTEDRMSMLLQRIYQHLPAQDVKGYLQTYKTGQEVIDALGGDVPDVSFNSYGYPALMCKVSNMPITKMDRVCALEYAVQDTVGNTDEDDIAYHVEYQYIVCLWHVCCGKIYGQLYRSELTAIANQRRHQAIHADNRKSKKEAAMLQSLAEQNAALTQELARLSADGLMVENQRREIARKNAIIAEKCDEVVALKKILKEKGWLATNSNETITSNLSVSNEQSFSDISDNIEKEQMDMEVPLSNEEVEEKLGTYLQQIKCVLVDGDEKLHTMLQAKFPISTVSRRRIATMDALIKGADIVVCKSPSYGSHTLRTKAEKVARSAGIPFVTLSRRTNVEVVIREIYDAVTKYYFQS